ncbi:glycosyltransferase [Curtanaerobium respiraculi]|uniref:glycosyltransferase n=1 Tax=Curtanaerobium respiraculi TaxID=2949669 RepID=UPI0024B3C13B|nr:glycosyltransferase [Curtanaerobium respiraculi]
MHRKHSTSTCDSMWHATDDQMPFFDFESLITSLTPDELAAGEALGIARIVRAELAEKHLIWVLLYVTKRSEKPDAPRLCGLFSIMNATVTMHRSDTRIVHAPDSDEPWYVHEFHMVAPHYLIAANIACGSARLAVAKQDKARLIQAHYAETRCATVDNAYPNWLIAHHVKMERIATPVSGPLMSIVSPLYKTPPHYLRAMIDSVISQTYGNWELVLVNASPDDDGIANVLEQYRDEARIVTIDHPENDGINGNTNFGIAATHGDYVSFLDHDDIVEPTALALIVAAIQENRGEVDLLYCDEDSLDGTGAFRLPLFKPGLNVDLLYSNNYAIHWLTVSRRVLDVTARSTGDLNGAQDYDLTLKAAECRGKAVRIPYVLYHWRIHQGSVSANPDSKPYALYAGARAVQQHLDRQGLKAHVAPDEIVFTYKTTFETPRREEASIDIVLKGTELPRSVRMEIDRYAAEYGTTCTVHLLDTLPLDGALIANMNGSLLCVLPPDIVSLSPHFLDTMAGYFQRPEVTCVSPHMLRADGLHDYAGSCVCPDGNILALNRFLPGEDGGYVGRAHRPHDYCAINPACFMTRTSSLHGFARQNNPFAGASYQIARYFIEQHAQGNLNVYTPFATVQLTGFPSLLEYGLIRGKPAERKAFADRFHELFPKGDPMHDPNFAAYSPYYRLNR